MKRYRFRLEPVLRARRAQEEAARLALAHANRTSHEAMAALDNEMTRYRNRDVPQGETTFEDLRAEMLEGEQAAGRLAVARTEQTEAADAVVVARHSWSEAAQRVATLERLESRRRGEWEVEARRQEEAAIDDIITSRRSQEAPR